MKRNDASSEPSNSSMFTICSVGLPSHKPLRDKECLTPSGSESWNRSELGFERVVFTVCLRGPQQTHHTAGGRGIQHCNHMIIFCIVHRDSAEVELCLDVLKPRVRIVLPKFW